MLFCALALSLLLPTASPAVAGEEPSEQAPSYSRAGVDFYSAPLDAAEKRTVPHACTKLFGKHTEVQALEKGYRCNINTPSEPRLTARLNEEIALIEVDEPKRTKVVETLIDKYAKLAQCPAGSEAYHDGSMYYCKRDFTPKQLCPSGAPTMLDSGEIGCVISSCPKGHTDLAALTLGAHPGCFKCPKGAYDEKETKAFYGALADMPADYKEVFCRAGGPVTKTDDAKAKADAPARTP